MGLTDEERAAIVSYRIDKAHAAINEAKIIMQHKLWTIVANRLYYAAYYAASAVLINNGFQVKTHAGVQALLGKEIVATGRIDTESAHCYGKLFQMRQTGDYGDNFDLTEEDVLPLLQPAEQLVEKLASLI